MKVARPAVMNVRQVLGITLCAALALTCACGSKDESRETDAARAFHQQLSEGRTDLIYAQSSDFLRAQYSEDQFRRSLLDTRIMGRLEASERAHYTRTETQQGGELLMAFYNTRYAKGSCLETFTWKVEGESLKLAAYTCARNMQVTCASGASCETSPVPVPGIAGLP
jgi:hypothetical protein